MARTGLRMLEGVDMTITSESLAISLKRIGVTNHLGESHVLTNKRTDEELRFPPLNTSPTVPRDARIQISRMR
jgi:hypothetical protein